MDYQKYNAGNLAYREEEKKTGKSEIRQVKANGAKTRRMRFNRSLAIVLYLMALGCSLIYGKLSLMEENNVLSETRAELEVLREDYVRLENEVNNMVSINTIEELAKAAGMTDLQPSQIENIVVETNDVAEVLSEDRNLLNDAADWLSNLKSYITK